MTAEEFDAICENYAKKLNGSPCNQTTTAVDVKNVFALMLIGLDPAERQKALHLIKSGEVNINNAPKVRVVSSEGVCTSLQRLVRELFQAFVADDDNRSDEEARLLAALDSNHPLGAAMEALQSEFLRFEAGRRLAA
jgi:hypothetical protein